ncbi:helix-turn-helix domain-containing protein [Virgibacillus ihumii]|uniref:helix-turn-helix domain-containing protein n=1 Tax=Virgibacillus ihumii TaxID=2686091 RepID=UPI00157BBE4E|nr:helix-turn-helix transcriptional regulator [Virgibacillus ihumii]
MDKEKLLMRFGELIRQYREKNGFTMYELAEELDISENHLGRIERGESNTVITNFYQMATILNIPSYFHDEMKQIVRDLEK